jgi:hypothetical protein
MSDVPSNLIPTRVTQLPIAPVADENSLMMIVYQGNNYQIRVGDLLSVAGVPTSRQVIAGTGLTGGGQLSSNVTLSIAPGGVGSTQLATSGVTPGTYGDASNIPVFIVDSTGRVMAASTVPVANTGGVPTTREVIAGTGLNGGGALSANVTLNANLSNATPEAGFQAGSAGVSTDIARADHKHPAVDLSDDDQVDNILGLSNGGTARSLVANAGAIVWSGADGLYIGAAGVYGQVLISGGTGQYQWASVATDAPQPPHYLYIGPTSGADASPTFRLLVSSDLPALIDGKTFTNVDINSGTIDGTTIGASTPAAGTFTAVTATTVDATTGNLTNVNATTVDTTNLEVTSLKAKDGTAAGSIANSTGVVTLNSAVLTTADVNGGTIDGAVIGATSPAAATFTTATATTANVTDVNATTVDTTNLEVTNLKAKDGTAAGSIANTTGVVTLNSVVLSTADINGGTADNVVIGATTPAAGTFTSVDAEYVDFAPALSPLPSDATGRVYYDNNDQFQTLTFQMNGSVIQHIGEEQFYRIKCQGAINKGQVVMFAGTLGASGSLVGAAATGLTPEQSNYILGIADETGNNNDWIFVNSFGEVKGINTTGGAEAWAQGDVLYYNPSATGGLTKIKPTAPNAIAIVAAVVHVGTSNGILFVRPTFGSVLGGTDGNVQFGTLNNGDVIVYNTATQRWENVSQSTLVVNTATNIAGGAANRIPYNTGAGVTSFISAPSVANTFLEWSGSAYQWSNNPLGTVTSVDVSGGLTGLTTLGGPVTTSGTITLGGTLITSHGGTGITSYNAGDMLYALGDGTLAKFAAGNAGEYLFSNGANFSPTWSKVDLTVSVQNVLPVANGGTGVTTSTGTGSVVRNTDPSLTNPVITGGSIDNTPVGATTATTVRGTTITATTQFTGSGAGLTNIPNGALTNSSVTIGSTSVSLGGTATTLAGLTSVTLTQDPTAALQAATKQYVDTLIASGIHFHQPVRVESPTNLNATYNNGSSGVGATLTNAGTQAALVIDGVTVSVNDRVLVYQQTTQTQNGIYVVTNVGSGSTNWVLTRASDADTYVINSAAGLSEGSTVFVQQGATGAGETYTCNTSGVITFGTTNITFAQISTAQVYSAGTGLTLTGTQFSITNTGVSASTYGSASAVPVFAVNAQGQLTSVTNTSIAIAASQVTSGQLAVAQGGTNSTAAPSAGAVAYGTGTAYAFSTVGTSGQVLTSAGASAPTWTTATSANTASAIVQRDASGNFSAGTITANLSGNASTATTASQTVAAVTFSNTGGAVAGTTFNGSTARTVDYSTVGAPKADGTGASGTWAINISGNAATATSLAGGAANRIAYQTGAGATGFVVAPTVANTFLEWSGTAFQWSSNPLGTVTSITAGAYLTGGTITTSGTIAVDATSANTASKVVARDSSGNFSAGTISAALSGNATSATNLAGGGAGQIPYNTASGTTAFLAAGTAGYVLQANGTSAPSWGVATISGVSLGSNLFSLTLGSYLTGTSYNGSSAITAAVDATSANTANKVVARDASGNFAANQITASKFVGVDGGTF